MSNMLIINVLIAKQAPTTRGEKVKLSPSTVFDSWRGTPDTQLGQLYFYLLAGNLVALQKDHGNGPIHGG